MTTTHLDGSDFVQPEMSDWTILVEDRLTMLVTETDPVARASLLHEASQALPYQAHTGVEQALIDRVHALIEAEGATGGH